MNTPLQKRIEKLETKTKYLENTMTGVKEKFDNTNAMLNKFFDFLEKELTTEQKAKLAKELSE